MEKIEKIKEIVEKNKGILYVKDLEKYNIHRQYVKELEEKEYLRKVARGLYVKKNKEVNEFFIMGQRYESGIYSHNTALYFYKLTDRTPLKLDMTFPSSIRIKNDIVHSHYIKDENYLLGMTNLELEDGTSIKIYNLERTICDIIRDKNKIDPQIFNTAMKEYSKIKNKNYYLLSKYAKKLKIYNKLQQYMEVLDWKETQWVSKPL